MALNHTTLPCRVALVSLTNETLHSCKTGVSIIWQSKGVCFSKMCFSNFEDAWRRILKMFDDGACHQVTTEASDLNQEKHVPSTSSAGAQDEPPAPKSFDLSLFWLTGPTHRYCSHRRKVCWDRDWGLATNWARPYSRFNTQTCFAVVQYSSFAVSLSCLARRALSVPACSAPSERAFSMRGRILYERRTMLRPSSASDILYLHCNLRNIRWRINLMPNKANEMFSRLL